MFVMSRKQPTVVWNSLEAAASLRGEARGQRGSIWRDVPVAEEKPPMKAEYAVGSGKACLSLPGKGG